MKSNKARVPQVGEKLHFFDDGKVSDSRHYMAVVTHVLTKEQMKMVSWTPSECLGHWEDNNGELHNVPKDFIEVWEYNKNNCNWLFADDTDFFIGAAIPEYDEHILWLYVQNMVIGFQWMPNHVGKVDVLMLTENGINEWFMKAILIRKGFNYGTRRI